MSINQFLSLLLNYPIRFISSLHALFTTATIIDRPSPSYTFKKAADAISADSSATPSPKFPPLSLRSCIPKSGTRAEVQGGAPTLRGMSSFFWGSRGLRDFLNVITGNRDVAPRELEIRLFEFRVRVLAQLLFSFPPTRLS